MFVKQKSRRELSEAHDDMVPVAGLEHSLRLAQGTALEPHWGSIHYRARSESLPFIVKTNATRKGWRPFLVPVAGLEPARLTARDFKSPSSAIPTHRQERLKKPRYGEYCTGKVPDLSRIKGSAGRRPDRLRPRTGRGVSSSAWEGASGPR